MPRRAASRRCPCGTALRGEHPVCSRCRRRAASMTRDHRGKAGGAGTSSLFPGHEERMARYEARAAARLPLFTREEPTK